MDYLLQQNYSERNTTLTCHVASVLLNVRDHSPKQQRSKLEAVFSVCFFSIFSLFTFRSSFSASSDRSGFNTVTWSLLMYQILLCLAYFFLKPQLWILNICFIFEVNILNKSLACIFADIVLCVSGTKPVIMDLLCELKTLHACRFLCIYCYFRDLIIYFDSSLSRSLLRSFFLPLFLHSLFHIFNLFSEDRQIECTVNRLNKSCFGFFFSPSFFVGGGWRGAFLRDTVGFHPQEAQGRLAVVNEPKWSPVIRSLICPLGAKERSGRGGCSSQLLVP